MDGLSPAYGLARRFGAIKGQRFFMLDEVTKGYRSHSPDQFDAASVTFIFVYVP